MTPRSRVLIALTTLLLLVPFAGRYGAAEEPAEPEVTPIEELAPVHVDSQLLVDAVLEVTRQFLREDPAATRAALDRIERNSRRLDSEKDAALGDDLVVYDRAFHLTLDRSRELALKGQLKEAFDHFVWVQRACVTCHGIARESGLLPAAPAPSDPAQSKE